MEGKKKIFIDEILHLLRTPENMKVKRNQLESVPMNIAMNISPIRGKMK